MTPKVTLTHQRLRTPLLFLAMMFMVAAMAGGIIASYAIAANQLIDSGVLVFGRAVMYTIGSVFAIRMAGVFMISLGTIWNQMRVMARRLCFSPTPWRCCCSSVSLSRCG